MIRKTTSTGLLALLLLTGCAHQSQNVYKAGEMGKTSTVSFGTVINTREIDVIGDNTGAGAIVGGAAGAGVGSMVGQGSGNAWAIGAGLVAGIAAGALAEQAIADRTGVEYTVTLQSGVTITVPQDVNKGEHIIQPGERVIVQNSGGYQRVLPANQLPTEMQQPKGITFVK